MSRVRQWKDPRSATRRRVAALLVAATLGLATAAASRDIFVVDRVASDVKSFDSNFGLLIGSFGDTGPTTNSLQALAFHPVTGNLFLTNASNGVQEFSATTGAFIGDFGDTAMHLSFPLDLAFHPATGDLLVVDNQGGATFDGAVRVFDGYTGMSKGDFGDTQTSLFTPTSLAFHPQTGNLLVASGVRVGQVVTRAVWEVDGETGNLIGGYGDTLTFEVSGPITIAPITGELFVANGTDPPILNDIRIFGPTGAWLGTDPDNPSWGDTRDSVQLPVALRVHPDRGSLLISDDQNDDVREFALGSGAFLGVLGDTGGILDPHGIALEPPPIEVDLSLRKRGPGGVLGSAMPTEIAYRIDISNGSGNDATNLLLTDTLPPNTTFVSAHEVRSGLAGLPITIMTPLSCSESPPGTVGCMLGTLATRLSLQIEFRVSVAGGLAPGTMLSNTANVLADQTDPDNLNNIDAATVIVVDSFGSVPDLFGVSPTAAASQLQFEGLDLGNVLFGFSDSTPESQVDSQTLAPGTNAPLGTTVDVLVSRGPAFQGSWGVLPTNDSNGFPGNEGIANWEIAAWIDESFADGAPGDGVVESDILVIGTSPYFGNFVTNFDAPTGANGMAWDDVSFIDTTAIAGNLAGQITAEPGAGNAILSAVDLAATATNVFAAGVDGAFTGFAGGADIDEQPLLVGDPTKLVGGSSSTHLLFWAAKPTEGDDDLIADLYQNFVGEAGVTITILSGSRSIETFTAAGTPVTTGPATRQQLQRAIQDIGPLMTPGEQFLFLVVAGGTISQAIPPFGLSPGGSFNLSIELDDAVLERFELDPEAKSTLKIGAGFDLSPPDVSFALNGCDLGSPIDANRPTGQRQLPGRVLTTVFHFDVPRNCIDGPTGPVDISAPVPVPQAFGATSKEGMDVPILFGELNLGTIPRALIPEPGRPAMLGAALIAAVCLRRTARRGFQAGLPTTRVAIRSAPSHHSRRR